MSRSSDFSRLTFLERFERSYTPEPNSGCWLWTGCVKGPERFPYGAIWYQGTQERAHRASWMAFRGPIPDGLFVCHRCDTPACVNPDHLFLGSNKDNMRDAKAKGRTRNGALNALGDNHWKHRYQERLTRGADNPKSKLTLSQVHEVRRRRQSGEAPADLATAYRVSKDVIYRCISGKRYGLPSMDVAKTRKRIAVIAEEEAKEKADV